MPEVNAGEGNFIIGSRVVFVSSRKMGKRAERLTMSVSLYGMVNGSRLSDITVQENRPWQS